ncbi:helix-turn-helix transcriptional regulator [Microbacterium sp. AZCO]|uniref:helix-turn-helix transcriptional regulator n=1 Tax=Microbacterium sp. AZCO TaxID=3142976 RepID=UPI0031F36879
MTAEVAPASGVNALPRAIRRATAYIEENLAAPISVTQIADAARISVRTLEYAFRRHFSTTPGAYLRVARLRQVNAELRDADPATTTVADVVRRWGITLQGRFAAEYRAEFGENPSETLRR